MFTKSKRKGTPRRWKAVVVLCLLIIASGITTYWLLRQPVDEEGIIYLQDDNLWRTTFEGQSVPEQLTNFTEYTVWQFDVSYDGRYVVIEATSGNWIRLLDLQTGEMRLVRDCEAEGENCVQVNFNPERNLILYTFGTGTAGSVWIYDVATDTHEQLYAIDGLYGEWFDAQHIHYQSRGNSYPIFNIETGQTINLSEFGVDFFPYGAVRNGVIALLPSDYDDGDCIQTVLTVGLEGVQSTLELDMPSHHCFSNFEFTELWSPDGSKIAYATRNPNRLGYITVMDVASGETSTVDRPTSTPLWMRWNPDGTRLLVTLVNGDNYHVVAYDLTTGEPAVIENATDAMWQR